MEYKCGVVGTGTKERKGESEDKTSQISSQYLTINVADCLSCFRYNLLSLHIFISSKAEAKISPHNQREKDEREK